MGCPWTMRDTGGSLAQNRWQGDLGLTAVGQDDMGAPTPACGIPPDHLMAHVSGHTIPTSVHLLGQTEPEWMGEYVEDEEEDDLAKADSMDKEEAEQEAAEEREQGFWDSEDPTERVEFYIPLWQTPKVSSQTSANSHFQPAPDKSDSEEEEMDHSLEESPQPSESCLRRGPGRTRAHRLQTGRSVGLAGLWRRWRQRALWMSKWRTGRVRYRLYTRRRRGRRVAHSSARVQRGISTLGQRDKYEVGSSADGRESRGLSVGERPVQPALTEEHISCVTGFLEQSLQQYGSLIPVYVDDVTEKLQTVFSESFSQPHRKAMVQHLMQSFQRTSGSTLAKGFRVNYKRHVLTMDDLGTLYGQNWLNDQVQSNNLNLHVLPVSERVSSGCSHFSSINPKHAQKAKTFHYIRGAQTFTI